jgi:hypothetical protein
VKGRGAREGRATLKMAVFAPMPMPSVTTAANENAQ